jgi:hypothetical protein
MPVLQKAVGALAVLAVAWPSVLAAQSRDSLPELAYFPGKSHPQTFFMIAYQCPPREGGLVEIVKMNSIGARLRFHVTVKGESVTNVSLQRAWRDTPFQSWHEFGDPRKKPEGEAERKMLDVILWDAEAIWMGLCLGVPTTREKVEKIIQHNRAHLKPTRFD